MAVVYSVFTRILGEDFASQAFRKVGEAAKAAFRPIEAFNTAVEKPHTTGLGVLGAKVDMVAGKFRSGLKSLTEWAPALAAISATASFAGLIEMTKKAAEGYKGLSLGAQRLGASTGDLAVWRFGAKLAGVEADALEKSLIKANRAMYDAATGKNKDVAALFAAMKIPLRDANGQVKGVTNSLEDIAEAFKNTHNAATRDAAAMVLFGRAGAQLIPFLVKGRDGITELRAELAKYYGLNERNRGDLEHLAESYEKIDKAGAGLSSKLAAVFAPVLSKVIDRTTDWIVANRDLIAQSLEHKLNAMAAAYRLVASAASSVVHFLGVDDFFKGACAATALNVGLGVLGITMAGPLLSGLQFVIAALWRMNAALYANPWVLLVAAIAAAAYAIYENWGPIKEWFGAQMDAIRAAFDRGLISGLVELWLRFNPVRLIMEAINGLSKWLLGIDLYAVGERLIKRMIDGIKAHLPDFNQVWAPIDRAITWVSSPGRAAASAFGSVQPTGPLAMPELPYIPSAPSPDSPASVGPGPGAKGKVEIQVDFTNVPKGVEVKSTSTNVTPSVNVGRSMHDQYGL
jgi:hypothetical protein